MDAVMTSMSSPYPELAPPQEDVDEFLRKKRKAREHKACYPCRQRKVKCDLTRPCKTCREREHPELCSYHPPNKRQTVEQLGSIPKLEDTPSRAVSTSAPGNSDAATISIGRGEFDFLCRKLQTLENSIADLKRDLKRNAHDRSPFHDVDVATGAIDPAMGGRRRAPTHTDVHGVHMRNDIGETVHFGAGSIPGLLYSLQMDQGHAEHHQIREMLGKNVLPLFALDNESVTYPFVDLWGLPHASLTRAQELARALPTDAQMLNLFRCYKTTIYVIYAGIASPEQLESDLTMFLINRAAQQGTEAGITEQQIYGKSYTWLALMFAVLASGAQCSTMSRTERELTSQVYVCCSFECLRFTNFLSRSNLESIQSLVVIGNVMTNNLNAGTSWSLMGLTIRLAQSLGLHQACPPGTPDEQTFPRSKVWWSIVWQDSLLSITYDRASPTSVLDFSTMPLPQQFGPTSSYHDVMYQFSKVGLEIVQDRARSMGPQDERARITEHRDALVNIMRDSADYLRDSRKCHTQQETLEHWSLYLHSSYHMSELCKPAISPNADPELVKAFKQTCVENLVNAVEAFLGLNNITMFARVSWAALHRALGSALMLGIIGEHTRNERANRLIGRFLNVMSDITNNIDAQEISAPIQRGLSALQKLSSASNYEPPSADRSMTDVTTVDQNGSLKLDRDSIVTPADTASGTDEGRSPYSVLNTILWGNSGGWPDGGTN